MSKKNRQSVATISQSTQNAADLRNGAAVITPTEEVQSLPVPTDAELNAGINTVGTTVEDVAAVLARRAILDSDINDRGRGNAHKSNFQAADDVAKKGPYASESEARLPYNVYRNQGKTAWELYEVEFPAGMEVPFDFSESRTCYTWACNSDLAISFVARKLGFDAEKAGQAARGGNGVKAKLDAANEKLDATQAALEKANAEREALLAKLKAAGIEL